MRIGWGNIDDFKLTKGGGFGYKSYKSLRLMEGANSCKICNEPYFTTNQQISNNKGLYCSRRCSGACGRGRITWVDVLDLFEGVKGWVVLTKESQWKSAMKDKVTFRCKNNHIHSYTYTSLNHRNCGCPYCNNNAPIKFSDIKKLFEDEGWVVLTKEPDYKSQNETPIDCICPNGHHQYKSVRKWRMGRRCIQCNSSGPELQIREYLESIYKRTIIYNDRKVLKGKELDVYFPDINKAIEFNGDYWHCNPHKYPPNYFHKHKGLFANEIWVNDKKKQRSCMKKGIDLIFLWDSNGLSFNKRLINKHLE